MLRTLAIGWSLIAVVVVSDTLIAKSRVPDVPPVCGSATDAPCNDERNAVLAERVTEAQEIEDGLQTRSIVAGVGVAAIGLMFAGFIARREPDDAELWAAASRDLGSATALWFVAGGALLLAGDGSLVAPSTAVILIPAAVLLPVAVIGTLVARSRGAEGEPTGPFGSMRTLSHVGLGAAAAASTLAILAADLAGGTCSTDGGDVQVVYALATAAGAASLVIGVVLLLARRWFASLVCIVAPPFIALFSTALAGCFS